MYQKPRGTKDVYGLEMAVTKYIVKTAFEVLSSYGFTEISTPMFEKSELYIRGVGEETDIVNKEMYTFEDKSGRMMTLRPEGTAGVARAYIEEALDTKMGLPLKLMYNMQIFRYEKVQKGRQRQFTQIGAELLGTEKPLADFEIINICYEIIKRLKIAEKITLKINSLGNKETREDYKLKLKEYASQHLDKYCSVCRRRYETNILRMLDCKESGCRVLNLEAPKIVDHLKEEDKEHFNELIQYLESSELNDKYEIDPYIVRGLDYYNRTVFEIVDSEGKAVLGGGRYDGLIENLGGKSVAAVGFAIGLERIKDIILEKYTEEELKEISPKIDYVIITEYNPVNNIYAEKIAEKLRKKGKTVVVDLNGRSFKSQMKNANKIGANKAIIIGEEEIAQNMVTLKNMETGEQIKIDKEEIE